MDTEPNPEPNVSDRDVAIAMMNYDTGFAKKLGRAVIETHASAHWIFAKALLETLEFADSGNKSKVAAIMQEHIGHLINETMNEADLRQIVEDNWPEEWQHYTEMAQYGKRRLQEVDEE